MCGFWFVKTRKDLLFVLARKGLERWMRGFGQKIKSVLIFLILFHSCSFTVYYLFRIFFKNKKLVSFFFNLKVIYLLSYILIFTHILWNLKGKTLFLVLEQVVPSSLLILDVRVNFLTHSFTGLWILSSGKNLSSFSRRG